MKKAINTALIGIAASLVMATPALAGETTTKSTWYCYTNSYGQETCTEEKTETEKFERVVVRELTKEEAEVINESVNVQEHVPLETALSPAQITSLMAVMGAAIASVIYKLRRTV